jgi:putative ABC transport system substrate-binding protein
VHRVLQGESPANISIEQPYRYKLFVNMKTAEEIGVTMPEEILYQAAGYYR